MSIVNATVEAFNARIESPEGKAKTAELTGSWIRDRLREVAFSRNVIPPEGVSRSDCQVSTSHDTLVKIVEIEPKSKAMSMDFRSQPSVRMVEGRRMAVPFFTISSEKFQKTEQELLAYTMPITKVIEDNSVKDIQEIEDRVFTVHIESAVQALQSEENSGGQEYNATSIRAGTANTDSVAIIKGELSLLADGVDFTVRPVQRPDLVNLFKIQDGSKLRCERILITEPDHDDVLQWTVEDFGDKIQSETVVDGYKYNTLLGRKVVRTIKTDILRTGNVYAFVAPEFLGKFFILNNTKFYIDKIANVITWQSWEDIAVSVINIKGVAKLELYRGSVRPDAEDTDYEDKVPMSEEDLGAENNRVSDGLYFPAISTY